MFQPGENVNIYYVMYREVIQWVVNKDNQYRILDTSVGAHVQHNEWVTC
jgi:hypothetical protein